MTQYTQIEWTDATWNPTTGCTKISPGCENCYAERIAERFRGVVGHPYERGFDLTLRPERLYQPLKWKSSRMIFVNSMSDLFHKVVPESFVDKIFETMELSSAGFRVLATPLFEEKCSTTGAALVPNFSNPVRVNGSVSQATLAAHDHP
jgi:protein gp37